MILLNYLTSTLLTIIDFFNSMLLTFLNNNIFEGVVITFIIYLASGSKIAKVIDTTAKLVGIAAGSTILYNNWVKGSSSSPNEEDNNKNKKDKKEDKKENNNISDNQGTNRI
jgi:hypothetical protein